jgi:tetratricopeptide (TPR) repeat protein
MAELPDPAVKKLILYFVYTPEASRVAGMLSALSSPDVLIVADKKLEEKLSHKKDSCTFLSVPGFCRLLQMKELPVILFDASSAETFSLAAWIKKCREQFTPGRVLIAAKEIKGLKDRLRSEWRYAFTGLDLNETHAPAICVSSGQLLPVFEKNTKLSSLIREFRKKPDLHFSYLYQEFRSIKPLPLFRGTLQAITGTLKSNFITPFLKNRFEAAGLRSENRFRLLFNWSLLLMLFLMPVLSEDFAVTGDEVLHHEHAKLVDEYFVKGNKAALNQPKTLLHLYGQSFDLFCLKVIRFLDTDRIYETRHMLISLSAWLCMLFISLTVFRLSNYKAAWMALLLLCFTPVFLGHGMNNSIDIPFALAFAGTIYYLILQVKTYPVIRLSHCWMLICLIAFGISIRAGGILLGAYLLMVYVLLYISRTGWKKFSLPQQLKVHRKLIFAAIVICTMGYFFGIRYWPYALQAPLHNPFKALTDLTFISSSLKQLFEGKRLFSAALPSYYLSKYMLITIPLAVLTGLVFYLIFLYKRIRTQWLIAFFLLFSVLFPVLYVAIVPVNIYSAWRHFLFVYPGIVILAAIGWNDLAQLFSRAFLRAAVLLALSAMLILPGRFIYLHHPFEYVYFNELAGGLNTAWKYYETDYYAASLKPCAEWLKNDPAFRSRKDTVVIATTSPAVVNYYLKDQANIKVIYTRYYQRNDIHWDYGLFYLEHISPFQLQNKLWPPAETIYTSTAGEAVLGLVLKNISDEDHLGTIAWRAKRNDESIEHFRRYLELVPNSEFALNGIASAFYNKKEYVKALHYADQALRFNPDYTYALQTKGLCFMQAGDHAAAKQVLQSLINNDPNYSDAYYYLAIVYLRTKEYEKSIYNCNYALKLDPSLREVYRIMSLAYAGAGDKYHAGEYQDIYLQGKQN